jgi:heptosyltransferase III
LRTAVAALRAAGHRVSLLAPSSAGRALVGAGAGEVEAVLPWEAASVASLFTDGGAIASETRAALSPFDAVLAYTSSPALVQALGTTGARVVVHPPHPPDGGPHAARWFAEPVVAFGADLAASPPLLVATRAEAGAARPWLDRLGGAGFLAVHPGSGSPRKNWPAERFASVVSAIANGAPWLLVEGPADAATTTALARLPSVVHAREIPVRVLSALLARAGLYVGNDSGVSHLAAAWGAPVLALFGPTDPAVWAPVGSRVTAIRSPDHAMTGLAVETALAAARTRR